MLYRATMTTPPPTDEIRQIVDQAMQAARHETAAGNLDQALALYQAVFDLQPGHAGAHHALAVLAREAGDVATAIPHYAAALENDPGTRAHWLDYLAALVEARQYAAARDLLALGRANGLHDPALDDIERLLASASAPESAEIDAAAALFAQGRLDEANAAARSLIERFPQHPFGWKLLGGVAHRRGEAEQALHGMAMSARFGPDDGETLSNLGLLLMRANRLQEAEITLRRAIAQLPDDPDAHNHLAITLAELGRLPEAQASASSALAAAPDHERAGITFALILQTQSRTLDAVAAYRAVLARNPDNTDARSNMLFCLSEMNEITPEALFAEHLDYGRQLERNIAPPAPWDNPPDPERPLRVGFVSGDLRSHAVASFIEPVFERLAGRPGVALYAYYTHTLVDATTERLRGYFDGWRNASMLDDAALQTQVRADGIDILFDLSGHTSFNRLPAFARRLAPLQVSWIGYPGTTGLDAMDYVLTDRKFLPHGRFDHLFTEKLVQLPLSVPFEPDANAPDLAPLPALENGHVTFGSFNRLSKINRQVIKAWAALLRAVPDARLLVAGMPSSDGHGPVRSWLEDEGIAAHRLEFHGRTGMIDYLALHNRVDLALDTFPYTGGTTTLHAGWMGVPTLTLAGGSVPGRQSASFLEHNGLAQFIAHDIDDFVARGVAVCADLAALAAIRASLRGRFMLPASDTMTRVADGVEQALRLMWRRWCQGLPPLSFEMPPPPDAPDQS